MDMRQGRTAVSVAGTAAGCAAGRRVDFRSAAILSREERGQAVVEMALVLPVLVLLVVGILEFGRLFGAYLTVAHAAREGARLAVTGATDAEIEDLVRRQASSLDGASDPARLTVSVTPPFSERTAGTRVTVSVDYGFEFLLPWIAGRSDPLFPLQARLSMEM